MSEYPKYIITLIHGTFSKDAKWTKESSFFRKELINTFGINNIKFEVFEWSGHNNHHERMRYGIELRSTLSELFQKYPDSDHYIAAHSHGGNIALYALESKRIAKNIKGLITMGTPFIHIAPRDLLSTRKVFQKIIPFIFVLSLAVFSYLFISWGITQDDYYLLFIAPFMILSIPFVWYYLRKYVIK
jgi:triacylglycerol esterase/lipase EstA (alpha/beta hydrolase family)